MKKEGIMNKPCNLSHQLPIYNLIGHPVKISNFTWTDLNLKSVSLSIFIISAKHNSFVEAITDCLSLLPSSYH